MARHQEAVATGGVRQAAPRGLPQQNGEREKEKCKRRIKDGESLWSSPSVPRLTTGCLQGCQSRVPGSGFAPWSSPVGRARPRTASQWQRTPWENFWGRRLTKPSKHDVETAHAVGMHIEQCAHNDSPCPSQKKPLIHLYTHVHKKKKKQYTHMVPPPTKKRPAESIYGYVR